MKDEPIIPAQIHFCASCNKRIITGAMPDYYYHLECLETPNDSPDFRYTVDIIPLFKGSLYFCSLKCLKYAVNYER